MLPKLSEMRTDLTTKSSSISVMAIVAENAVFDDADLSEADRSSVVDDLKEIEAKMDALRRKLFRLQR